MPKTKFNEFQALIREYTISFQCWKKLEDSRTSLAYLFQVSKQLNASKTYTLFENE